MKAVAGLALALAMSATMALSDGLGSSLLPKPRPATAVPQVLATVATSNMAVIKPMLRPRARPESVVKAAARAMAKAVPGPELQFENIVELSGPVGPSVLRPRARPANLANAVQRTEPGKPKGWSLFRAAAVRTQPGNESILPKKGSVCGDASIRGEVLAPIVGKIASCGVDEPVRVTSVAGVTLSEAATIDCPTAIALKSWVEQGVQPAFGKNPVVQLQIAGHYVCRPRNNIRGNKISEHGRGKALDISGFVLADGKRLSIEGDYRKFAAIKAAHKAACGIFGTTLGPGSDGHHNDHLHFDTARYRSGAYCR